MKQILEYIWLDADGKFRSKVKVAENIRYFDYDTGKKKKLNVYFPNGVMMGHQPAKHPIPEIRK